MSSALDKGIDSSDDHKLDLQTSVKALLKEARQLHTNFTSGTSFESLINKLKQNLVQEKRIYACQQQRSELQKHIESLQNLIQSLESNLRKLHKAAARKGWKQCLTKISKKVLGDELSRIGRCMESEIQSWLDQQRVRELATIIGTGTEDAQLKAISSFESIVKKGYDSQLQGTILSTGLVEKLASLLRANAASWRVQNEAAFALSALLEFNKDIFVSLILMANVVEYLVALMDSESSEEILTFVWVLKSFLLAGHTVSVEEIYAKNGVSKLAQLLERKHTSLQHATMDCMFELIYHGRLEVVQKLFELGVVKKIARLQNSSCRVLTAIESEKKEGMDGGLQHADSKPSVGKQVINVTCPFANAVTRFAIHLSISTGLRQREKQILKQDFLRQIKEVIHDDAEIANITTEVLWTP